MKQTYTVKKQIGPHPSKVNKDSYFWEITLVGTRDKRTYTTYVDTEMKNFDQWIEILENPQTAYELADLKLKSPTSRIINADSTPRIVHQGGSTTFNKFFSFE
jgi:hypothetical protein